MDIDVEPAADFLLFWRYGFHNLSAQGDLVEGSHALLAVQQKRLRGRLTGGRRRAFNRARFEIDRPACIERHKRANRKGSRDRRDKALDAVFIPNPAALKIGQLDDAPVAFV